MNVLVNVLNVQCYASGEMRCSVAISVVIGPCLIELGMGNDSFLGEQSSTRGST